MLLTLSVFTDWVGKMTTSGSHFSWVEFTILFALLFIETAGIVTGFIPADALVMTAAGFAGAHHNLSEYLILIAVFALASFSGDSVNYWLGAFIVKLVDKIPLIKRHLNGDFANQIALNLPQKRWLLFIVLGRFIPFVRTVVPLMAHRLGLAYRVYIQMAILASTLWATVMVSIGYFAGHLEIPQGIKWTIIVVVLVAVIVIIQQPRFRQLILDVLIGKQITQAKNKKD